MTHPSSPPTPMTAEDVHQDYWSPETIAELVNSNRALTARVAELERDNADVLKLGDEFGFEDRPFSVSQVLTHARYLQSERARLLFESVTLKAELAAARKVEDGEVAALVAQLRHFPPHPMCGAAADLLTRLSAAQNDAEAKLGTARRDAQEAYDALISDLPDSARRSRAMTAIRRALQTKDTTK